MNHKLQKQAEWIYQKTQRDCSDFSDRNGVKIAQQKILSRLDQHDIVNARDKVLDVGCGAGQFISLVAERFQCEAHGVTYSEGEIAQAQERGIQVERSDMHDLPYESGQFNTVYAGHVLEHSTSPLLALMEWRRVLADGGHLVVWGPIGRDFRGHDDGTVVYGCPEHLMTPTEWQYKWLFEISDFSLVGEYDITYRLEGRKAKTLNWLRQTADSALNMIGLTFLPHIQRGTAYLFILKKEAAHNRLELRHLRIC